MQALLSSQRALVDLALEGARALTSNGKRIDEAQVVVESVAYAATLARAAAALAEVQKSTQAQFPVGYIEAGCVDLVRRSLEKLAPACSELALNDAPCRAAVREAETRWGVATVTSIGRAVLEQGMAFEWPLDETLCEIRQNARQFAAREIAPIAEHVHRHDELIPERVIGAMSAQGYFGLSIPEQYDGHDLGNLAMVLTTEELARASLAVGGSLITRPEILAKALLAGGTDAQKKYWLPRIASGETMVAISVTEPNVGSDVASVACRAEATLHNGKPAWVISGAKAWCTFAGRADVIALLARTETAGGASGLSLFIVPKPRCLGHAFVAEGPLGGKIVGKADRTLGYRGMHSFTLSFDDYVVSDDSLVGGDAGRGKGFALQMAGFVAGRLQTGGRAIGLAQAALDVTSRYALERKQFGRPLAQFSLTQFELGRMALALAGARALTYEAARAMDEARPDAALLAASAKLLACDMAVWATQVGQVLHGGWGYAEEYAISRYVVDALVLPIFEGVRPVLTLKVIGRALLASDVK